MVERARIQASTPVRTAFADVLRQLIRAQDAPAVEMSSRNAFRTLFLDTLDELEARWVADLRSRLAALPHSVLAQIAVLEAFPSVLAPIGRSRNEVTHTKWLAWWLDKPGEYGGLVRDAFGQAIGQRLPTDGWRVANEAMISPKRRVDIRIHVPDHALVLVEAKVDAPEGPDQLIDYRVAVDDQVRQGETPLLVYLTRSGASDREADDAAHVHTTWLSLLRAVLERIRLEALAGPDGVLLGCWVATLAQDVCQVAGAGPVQGWSRRRQARLLDVLDAHAAEGGTMGVVSAELATVFERWERVGKHLFTRQKPSGMTFEAFGAIKAFEPELRSEWDAVLIACRDHILERARREPRFSGAHQRNTDRNRQAHAWVDVALAERRIHVAVALKELSGHGMGLYTWVWTEEKQHPADIFDRLRERSFDVWLGDHGEVVRRVEPLPGAGEALARVGGRVVDSLWPMVEVTRAVVDGTDAV